MADPLSAVYAPPELTPLLTTSVITFLSGFALGVYSIRGYLVPRSWVSARERSLRDPVESDESDVDEGDTILDHAPNWANAEDADRRQGLRVRKAGDGNGGRKNKNKRKEEEEAAAAAAAAAEEAKEKETAAAAATTPRLDLLSGGGRSNEECKLVLVVRTDLGMTKGKIAAQCSHATLACYKTLSRRADAASSSVLRRWERQGQAKIAVQTKSEAELTALMARARALGLTAEVIQDAGRTQIDPGSLTVLGVGPAPKSLVDQVTGGLKLL